SSVVAPNQRCSARQTDSALFLLFSTVSTLCIKRGESDLEGRNHHNQHAEREATVDVAAQAGRRATSGPGTTFTDHTTAPRADPDGETGTLFASSPLILV